MVNSVVTIQIQLNAREELSKFAISTASPLWLFSVCLRGITFSHCLKLTETGWKCAHMAFAISLSNTNWLKLVDGGDLVFDDDDVNESSIGLVCLGIYSNTILIGLINVKVTLSSIFKTTIIIIRIRMASDSGSRGATNSRFLFSLSPGPCQYLLLYCYWVSSWSSSFTIIWY